MKRILLFAGTTEGRKLAESLREQPVEVYVSTATEYGEKGIKPGRNIEVLCGRMNQTEISRFIAEQQIGLVIDATHPFAQEVTKNIHGACKAEQVMYIRCLREKQTDEGKGDVVYTDSVAAAVSFLKGTTGRILIATGSKELKEYTKIIDYKERCCARILSVEASLKEALSLGFEGKQLIAMQGPFSTELNIALLKQVGAKYFVTKESGDVGGFTQKKVAARETGATLVVIERPAEQGMSFTETKNYLKGYLKEQEV